MLIKNEHEYKKRVKNAIKKDLEASQIYAENRYLRQLVDKYETALKNISNRVNYLEAQLLKYKHFSDLKTRYIKSITYLQEELERIKNDNLLLRKQNNSYKEYISKNKKMLDYFNNLNDILQKLRAGKIDYYTDDIILMNKDYWHSLESRAALVDNLEYYENLLNDTMDEYKRYKIMTNQIKTETYNYDLEGE
ncbi:MAG: hypothetical protein ACTSPP_10490 [Candidatus Heimdallarchaeaceae archaeon]